MFFLHVNDYYIIHDSHTHTCVSVMDTQRVETSLTLIQIKPSVVQRIKMMMNNGVLGHLVVDLVKKLVNDLVKKIRMILSGRL